MHGAVERHVVHPDGATALLASRPPTALERHVQKLWVASWGVCVASIVASWFFGNAAALAFLVGLAGIAYFGWFSGVADFATRLNEWEPGDWHEPTPLNGWVPRSTAQLAAVEQLADDHEGLAYVRSDGPTLEVLAHRRATVERYWVDERGAARTASVEAQTGWYWAEKVALVSAAISLTAAIVMLFTSHFVTAGILAATFVISALVADRDERVASQLRRDDRPWVEIRTRVDDSD